MIAVNLLYKVAERTKELSGMTVNELRYRLGTADTYHGAIAEHKHKGRGELIEEILIEEFEDLAKQVDDTENG